ncbi:hypothetical protein VSR01_00585 [Actinacidiphila sp. DG2A-62]|nr:hypothetical protein [Actinacidiphila sp. DG2A-62]MEC3992120.1 hypothetical protein [Actinacidiphila sp. DG2A-62]
MAAVRAAAQETRRSCLVMLRALTGWPAPAKQNTGKAHGSAQGEDEVAASWTPHPWNAPAQRRQPPKAAVQARPRPLTPSGAAESPPSA